VNKIKIQTEEEQPQQQLMLSEPYRLNNYFGSIEDITMNSLKIYYLEVLKRIPEDQWLKIYEYIQETKRFKFEKKIISKLRSVEQIGFNKSIDKQRLEEGGGGLRRINSISTVESKEKEKESSEKEQQVKSAGIQITTEDAYTLTDGPTIFLTEDVAKIAHFYIQQTAIPTNTFQDILRKINSNKELSEKISGLERFLEDNDKSTVSKTGGDNTKKESKTVADTEDKNPETAKKYRELESLREQIRLISLDPVYVPNTVPHQLKWSPIKDNKIQKTEIQKTEILKSAFIPTIEEEVVRDIMSIDIENYQKVLLLMGIGLFLENPNPRYLEIMKSMAYKQHLFIIIASSDYIFGTNYSFCHGFIGKDLMKMTQQKTLQSLGRIGRFSIQQTYTVRFRDEEMIRNLFRFQEENIEAVNMCRLFNSD
jgi:hypothetical protein